MGEVQLGVKLVGWTQGPETVQFDSNEQPTEICGKAGGICYDKEDKESYENFIRGIIKSGHESVIEHASFTFRVVGVSRALTHQLVRHRLVSYSQRSQRYVKEGGFEYIIPTSVNVVTKNNPEIPELESPVALEEFIQFMCHSQNVYNKLIGYGIRSEDARFVLPNACETRIFITMNARELRHFFKLRMDKHAQWEIRRMACAMYDLVKDVAHVFVEDLQELRDGEWNSGW